ncbi:hypothetical protein SOPEG_2968 [Candidatus Sodalis pierantonius str. SOPE]|uniref:Phage protein n=1 Tax=Candidatus Sodalis pierantonii str. SOPE TaxID=2342 RepID=W0HKT8_9GAMM|nr:hypothetical protein [Candidatus Sodalis pierantonius]AHF74476.1 hypothetical protein SOPEG_2968 [Candidatus Sodalis pierantonius str. SOPE]
MRIPVGNFGNATPAAQPTCVDVGNTGAVANALQHLASVGIGVAEQQQRRIEQERQSHLQALTLQLDNFTHGLVNDPEHGLLSLQGTNAEGATGYYTRQYEDFANKLAAELPSDMLEPFQQQAIARRIQLERTGLSHELGQRRRVEQGNFESTIANSQTRAAGFWHDNVSYQLEVGSAQQQIAEYGKAHGWTPEQISEQQNNYVKTTALTTAQNIAVSNPADFVRLAGEPSDAGGGGAMRYSGGSATEPVGVRSNNPGNLVRTENTWEGETKGDGRFASFATPEHGLRALCKNLLAYNKRGYNTVEQIIGRWAPPNENDTVAYIAAISKALGVPAGKRLDLTDINTLTALCAGITEHENGGNPYSKEQISTGAMSALGLVTLPASDGNHLRAAGETTAVTQLDPVQLARLRSVAQGQLSQQQREYRVELEGELKDFTAAALRGKNYPREFTADEFTRAYGYDAGQKEYANYLDTQQLGSDISTVQQLSPVGQQALLNARQPVPGEGYAEAAKRHETLQKAVEYVNRARMQDPIQYATEQKQIDPLDMQTPDSLSAGLSARASLTPELARHYGTPLAIFSQSEASQIGEMLRSAPASQSVAYLDAMRQGLGSGAQYSAALQQVSRYAPSAAVAGAIMGKRGNVIGNSGWFSDSTVSLDDAAKTIIEGANARAGVTTNVNGIENKTRGIEMPKDTDLRPEFVDKVGKAFAGDAEGAAQAYDVAKDYYAGVMARKGNVSGEYDKDTWTQAINVATGGVYNYGGQGDVLLPWGISESQFNKAVGVAWKEQVLDDGIKPPPGRYGLQSHGDSQYLVKLGGGYLIGKDGRPVVLRIDAEKLRFGEEGIPQ